ncbi:MAG: rod shape-determining protein RodA [bacterium]
MKTNGSSDLPGLNLRSLLSYFPSGDAKLLLAYLGLCCFSLAILWSVTEGLRGPYEDFDPGVPKTIFYRQLVWVFVGWIVLAVASRLPLHHLENLAAPIYLGMLVMLVVVLFWGPAVSGAHRWLAFGPLRIQPSEVAKICFILVMASLLSKYQGSRRQLAPTTLSLLLMAVPFFLVLWEPDLGTSLVFLALWLGMIFWYGISGVFLLVLLTAILSAVISFYSESIAHQRWFWGTYLLLLIGLLYWRRFRFQESAIIMLGNIFTGIGIPYLWVRLQPYQQARIMSFFRPEEDALGSGYQAIQSKVAIGSGGLFGTHYLQGTQKGLAFLPERHTDFIFSVVGEELGFAGAVVLLGLFLVIILRGLSLSLAAQRPYPSYVAMGVTVYFTFHVIVNVAITTGLLPVTGLPLPLISYGGSNLLASSFLLGLLCNIGSRRFET